MNSKHPPVMPAEAGIQSLWIPAFAGMTMFLLSGCGIGEGNTVERLDIIPATNITQLKTFEVGDRYKLFECLRDELLVRATFTDGTQVNFSNRSTWSTSDASIVQVSNNDIPAVLAIGSPDNDGAFYTVPDLNYGNGTVVPVGTPGQTAVITAKFASLSASIEVEIRTPSFRMVAAPDPNVATSAPPYYFAAGTTQRLTVLANFDGKTVKAVNITGGVQNGFNINPLRYVFTGGTFIPQDDAIEDDVEQWVIDSGADRIAAMRSTTTDAFIDGVTADFAPHEVSAETSLCPGSSDPTLRPVADIQVATFYDDPGTPADDTLVLSREAGFHGSGFAIEDQVLGSSQEFQVRAKLDADGDGLNIVEQHFNAQGVYALMPLDTTCEDDEALLGCSQNGDFVVSGTLLLAGLGAAEGDTARFQACFPLCLLPRASLDADDTTVGTGVAVTFTALAVNPPPEVTINYLFDFGDDTTLGPQASPLASHAYATAGQYTATVRLVDAAFPAQFLSQNAGAVRVLAGVSPAPGNTAPVADLNVTFDSAGKAPLTATLSSSSTDSDGGDSLTVYEFDPGDGTPVIRQTSSVLVHQYLDGTASPFTPTLRVYDESGVASTPVSGSAVTVNGVSPTPLRSNVLGLRARKGTLCSAEILPPLAAATTEAAFSFPGARFDVMGAFVADTDTDTCSDPVIGTQLITRNVTFNVYPAGTDDEVSDIVGVRLTSDDFQSTGHVLYSNDVAVDTVLDVTGVVGPPFNEDAVVTPTTLTVTPCTTCTP